MNLGIDIDDTLLNTRENQIIYWKQYHQKYPNDKYTDELPENINQFGDEYINTFWDIYRAKLFDSAFKENASFVLHALKNMGYKISIITSRRKEKYPNLINKIMESFIENDIPYDEIFTDVKEKGLCMLENNIDILIDDEIFNCENAIKYGKKAILFNDRPDYEGLQTTCWLDVLAILSKEKHKTLSRISR